jgi:hypothetical protein
MFVSFKKMYNVKLSCAKPLVLNKEKVERLIVSTFTSEFVLEGHSGLAHWFIKKVCVNENNEIAIECTDTNRMIFRYIDINGKLTKITGKEIFSIIKECIPCFLNSDIYNILNESIAYNNYMDRAMISDAINPDIGCIKTMCYLVSKKSLISLIN